MKSLDHLKHVEEFVELMNAITNSKQFSILPAVMKERGDKTMMTILFDEAEARSISKGISIGEARGVSKGFFLREKQGEIKG